MRPGRFLLFALVGVAGCARGAPVADHQPVAPTSAPTASRSTSETARLTTTTVPTTTVPATTAQAIRPADDPAGLAAELTDVESRLHDPRTPSDLLAFEALRQQLAFERLASHPDWLPVVLGAVPTQWRATVEANSDAAIDLRSLSTPQSALPAWRITAPTSSPATLLGYYKQAEATSGVPWQVLAAVHLVETKMSRLESNSSAGAQGPMQFIPATWASYGQGNIDDDHDAILGAANYLRAMGAQGDLAGALYHYNPSHAYVQAVMAYADQMRSDPSAFTAYYHWQVLFLLGDGEVVLPEGYPTVAAVAAS